MKDVFFIAGALSDIGKAMINLALEMGRKETFVLADLPARVKELEMMRLETKERFPDADFITMELDVREVEKMEPKLKALFDQGYQVKSFAYLIGTNVVESTISVNETTWDKIMDVNLKGFFFLSQCIGAQMMEGDGGSIVSIASQHGSAPNYNRAVYCASKAGLIRLSEALALDWAKYHIRVNTVSPTYMKTAHNETQVETRAFANKWLNSIPLHKCAEPEDVANAALFLLSEQSGMITGHDLVVDGGWLLKHS